MGSGAKLATVVHGHLPDGSSASTPSFFLLLCFPCPSPWACRVPLIFSTLVQNLTSCKAQFGLSATFIICLCSCVLIYSFLPHKSLVALEKDLYQMYSEEETPSFH